MSYSLTQKAIDTEGIPLAPKAVLVVLTRHAKDDGTNKRCPSVQTIADKAGMSGKCARNALRWLEGEGWIEALGNKAGGRRQTTNYRVVLGRLGPDETRNDVPPIEAETRHHVPRNGHDTRNDVPPNICETRNDVPLNAERRSAEYVTEEKKDSMEGLESHAGVRETVAPPSEGTPGSGKRNVVPIHAPFLLADDWEVPSAWIAWAVEKGLTPILAERAAARFLTHWLRKADSRGCRIALTIGGYLAEWRKWVIEDLAKLAEDRRTAEPETGAERLIRRAREEQEKANRMYGGSP